ncbi:AraC family transcriptional regulator of adaptative response / DNA-3-methyladenine glycosylase II [Kineococcus xinjiangensis]|uniref:AraC family transcriptional regulator of adaptative response / DNA-3-methyladenine glycosylase II n=1 Tax=Kineococcus xinjiangensis TaxID=512762 RepID=A0A2S6ICA4_9ACTN|nr:AlkA N-terminal domain-containing protein [Kineococcus xinjiangensis]PPK90817.1 AraC family transcriptional regulator of adaptative response / DNA-3-methyladenine glycosylase II [Kineococcus xinjiangensis]
MPDPRSDLAPDVPAGAGLDPEACYRAAAGRDPRFDGRIYLAVATTGIYCRPSCPARTPRPENCRWFRSAAAAVSAGFRACKRCRPDALPGTRDHDASAGLADRAVRLIGEGAVDDGGIAGLAARLAVSERHLHRVLVAAVGAGPQQLNRTRRAQTARMLLEQTPLPVTDVAFAAGFASVRQFNDVMRAEFALTPSQLRRTRAPEDGRAPAEPSAPVLVLRLRHRPPLALAVLRETLAARAVPGAERVEDGRHTRCVPGGHGPALVTAHLGPHEGAGRGGDSGGHVGVRLRLASLDDLGAVVARVRRWLDLDADPVQIDSALAADPDLAALVAARPGLRLPGAPDPFEAAVRALLGPERPAAARLVARWGADAGEGLRAFPGAADLAAAGPDALAAEGVPAPAARTVHALAEAVASGLDLGPGCDRAAVRAALARLPGAAERPAEAVACAALHDPDALPASDPALQRRLGVRTAAAVRARAAAWRPWRAYAAAHLLLPQPPPPPSAPARPTEEPS